MNERTGRVDTVVIGAGLAGLATAAYLARGGRRVVVLERSGAPGGRAATHVREGFRLNLGPHALYRGGTGLAVLAELGVSVRGGTPGVSGGYAIARGAKHALPGGFLSLLTTGLFGVGAKLETARLLGGIARIEASELERVSVRTFLEKTIRHPDVRGLVAALFRLATYADCPERMSAGVAVRQLQLALAQGVLYLDGGWQTIVDGLRAAAEEAGASVRTGFGVDSLSAADGGWRLGRGEKSLQTPSVVVALPLVEAVALLRDLSPSIRTFAGEALPVRAACLDVGLSRLPDARARFALGIDRPLYFSVHSAVAKLAPEGGALIHAAKYLHPDTKTDAKADERELEELLDLVQPGWRGVAVERRFLPSMLASSSLPLASRGGLRGRPASAVPDLPGLHLVGDWVGSEGYLADASLASARTVATMILREASGRAAA